MGIHYDYKSKRGERAMLKEAKRKARLAQRIKNKQDIFDRNIKYEKILIDESFPKYIFDNQEKFKEWII